jgi:hypothetical protein
MPMKIPLENKALQLKDDSLTLKLAEPSKCLPPRKSNWNGKFLA